MSCCPSSVESRADADGTMRHGLSQAEASEFDTYVRPAGDGLSVISFVVPDMHCAACIGRIEGALNADPAVTKARVNMQAKRVAVTWHTGRMTAPAIAETIERLGYETHPFAADAAQDDPVKAQTRGLALALAVAGFAAGNVMLLSVSVWSGATDTTRELFHWLSAAIAIPAVAFSIRPFLRSAWSALRVFQLNMDVPISLAVLLATGISFYETMTGGPVTYFDAALMLLFFLLGGRYLDGLMRGRVHGAVAGLRSLAPRGAQVVGDDGDTEFRPLDEIEAGSTVRIAAGETVPVDGVVLAGRGDIDRSMLTGESVPEAAAPGTLVHAGTAVVSGALDARVEAVGTKTVLASIIDTMEQAERHKARYVRLADAAARLYAPVVHLTALAAFIFWVWAGVGWHAAAFTAIAVLIITCPCALGLAVPAVHVAAAGALYRAGIMAKSGDALERLAVIDRVVFDKTGTLTSGQPRLADGSAGDGRILALAAGLAVHSAHPLSRATVAAALERGLLPTKIDAVDELPGCGLSGKVGSRSVKLGSHAWLGVALPDQVASGPALAFVADGAAPVTFRFEDEARAAAGATLRALEDRGLAIEIVSGDRDGPVAHLADSLGVTGRIAAASPGDKVGHLQELAQAGSKVLMVGDGINDAPALAAAHVSMAPASAADAGRMAADVVFFGETLAPAADAHAIAVKARRLVLQNFALAAIYNAIAIPIAFAGYASPLVAAIAMSSSSLVVCANALRMNRVRGTITARAMPERDAPTGTPRAADLREAA